MVFVCLLLWKTDSATYPKLRFDGPQANQKYLWNLKANIMQKWEPSIRTHLNTIYTQVQDDIVGSSFYLL